MSSSLPLLNNGGVNGSRYTFSYSSPDEGSGKLYISTTFPSGNVSASVL
jgi:hypothetical protein